MLVLPFIKTSEILFETCFIHILCRLWGVDIYYYEIYIFYIAQFGFYSFWFSFNIQWKYIFFLRRLPKNLYIKLNFFCLLVAFYDHELFNEAFLYIIKITNWVWFWFICSGLKIIKNNRLMKFVWGFLLYY